MCHLLLSSLPLVLTYLLPRSGWYDPLIQNLAYLQFATDAPGYGQLQSDEVLAQMNDAYFRAGGCRDQELACYNATGTASNRVCINADNLCVRRAYAVALILRSNKPLS